MGSRYPALASASGRCIAAFGGHAWGEIERRFRSVRWDHPPTLAEWRTDVEGTRLAGHAVDEDRCIAGVTIVTAPVMRRGRMSHGSVVLGVSEQLRRIGHAAICTEVAAEAATPSKRLEDG